MTGAYRFKGLGWFLGGVIIVLGFYLVSLQVAAERKKVSDVERAISLAKRDIRSLETEFNTRANMTQLERWNGDVLALAAPVAGQYVRDEATLAQIDFRRPALSGQPRVETAAYVVPSAPAESQPVITNASVTTTPDGQAPKITRAVALLDRNLLSESVLGDLAARASAEIVTSR